MGKRLPAAVAAAAVRSYARSLRSPSAAEAAAKAAKTPRAPLDTPRNAAAATGAASSGRAEVRDLAAACGLQEDERVPLSEVVLDCTKRWFQDALKEARAGDAAMQVLVGQMYRCGYGVNRNEHKARVWMEKASRYRSTVWKGTMLVTQTQNRMMLSKHANNKNFKLLQCTAPVTTKPAKQHKYHCKLQMPSSVKESIPGRVTSHL
ncbi:hypothetical protein EJB05_06974, partial [Eragrostis curvula]